MQFKKPLLSGQEAVQFARNSRMTPIDATWYMEKQGVPQSPEELFSDRRLPGASRFDIDALGDPASELPHMLPSSSMMQAFASKAGISSLSDPILVYVHPNSFNAPRVWWTFRVFGFTNVAILQGGIRMWEEAGGAVEASSASEVETPLIPLKVNDRWVLSLRDMRDNVASQQLAMVDTRSARSYSVGHIPGAISVPYETMLQEDWDCMKSPQALAQEFRKKGIDLTKTVMATCGSGVSTCIFVFGAHLLGTPLDLLPVYDGSFAQWGHARMDRGLCPIVAGPSPLGVK